MVVSSSNEKSRSAFAIIGASFTLFIVIVTSSETERAFVSLERDRVVSVLPAIISVAVKLIVSLPAQSATGVNVTIPSEISTPIFTLSAKVNAKLSPS